MKATKSVGMIALVLMIAVLAVSPALASTTTQYASTNIVGSTNTISVSGNVVYGSSGAVTQTATSTVIGSKNTINGVCQRRHLFFRNHNSGSEVLLRWVLRTRSTLAQT